MIAEGTTVLKDFDIVAASGGQNTAIVVPVNGVKVTDGSLTLVFRAVADYPSIAGIEVLCPGACPPPDTTPPGPPTNVTASVVGPDVQLDWPTVAGGDIGGYNVSRSSVAGGPYTLLNQGLVTVSRYTDAAPGQGTWFYRGDHGRHGGQRVGTRPDERTVGQATDTFTTVNWSTVAQNPLPRHEAFGAVVDGKFYFFGGYFDENPQMFTPTTTGGLLRSLDRHLDAHRRPAGRTLPCRGDGGRHQHLLRRRLSRSGGWHRPELLDDRRVEIRHAREHVHLHAGVARRPRGGALVAVDGFLHFFGGSNPSRGMRPQRTTGGSI